MNIAPILPLYGTMVLLLLVSWGSSAQNHPMIELNQLMFLDNKSSNSIGNKEAEEIGFLIYDLNPMVYITGSEIKAFGNGAPVMAVIDSANYQILENPNPLFNSVELLKIKLMEAGQLNPIINLAQLKAFSNLKYVFVECSFDCGRSKIEGMFSNVGDITILYLVATPE